MKSAAGDRLPSQQVRNLEKLAAKGRELHELVEDLLDYARADRVDPSPLRLEPVIEQCLVTVEPMVDRNRVQLGCELPADLPELMQDRKKLRSIVSNLLTNAAKFTDHGRIGVSAHRRGDHLEIAVSDTGIGIAGESLARIFEEFERVDASDGRYRPGLGLGLAICRRFAGLLGGKISVQSHPGEGSIFTLTIPIVHPVAAGSAAGTPAVAAHRVATIGAVDRPATVLVVDDSAANRDVLVQLLDGRYRTVVATDGREAIETAQRERPDIILMDLSLPILDGWEATRRIRRDPALSSIPIIAVTAQTSRRDHEAAIEAGCDDFLAKPVDEATLLDALRRRLVSPIRGGA